MREQYDISAKSFSQKMQRLTWPLLKGLSEGGLRNKPWTPKESLR